MSISDRSPSMPRRDSQRKPPGPQLVENKKPVGRVLSIVEERIVRDWDRGVRPRSLARMYELRTYEIWHIIWSYRHAGPRRPCAPMREAA